MHSLQEWCAGTVTYIIGIWGMYHGGVMGFLGLILVIARLIQEVPRAYNTIMKRQQKND